MKKIKIGLLVGVLVAMCIGLASCMLPGELVGGAVPVASFDVTIDDLAVTFDGSNSYDVYGGAISYDWYFGDGAISARKKPRHTYANYGTYSVLLIVTNESGDTGRAEREITITGELDFDPVVLFSYIPAKIQTDSIVIFNGSESHAIGTKIYWCRWDFGDGETTGKESWEKAKTVWHTYQDAGIYTVFLTVWDGNGKVKSTWHSITVK